ncbi:MAG: hypothetical protein HC828_07690, partial [Blastochloris sp.]|nr:hypothetical protein [Blastochloris sp.]
MTNHSILVVNSSGGLGGDVAMVLAGLPALIESGYRLHAASIPQGPVFEQLQAIPQLRLDALYMGGSDLHPRRYNPAPLRALESVAAVARLSALVWREAIDAIYTFDRTASMPVAYAVSLLTGRPLIYNAQISFYLAQSRLHRAVVRHATRISVSSEQMRARFLPYVRDPQR